MWENSVRSAIDSLEVSVGSTLNGRGGVWSAVPVTSASALSVVRIFILNGCVKEAKS